MSREHREVEEVTRRVEDLADAAVWFVQSRSGIVEFPDLDRIDQEIIRLLRQDGRMSNAEIGRRLSISRVAIRERVNRLLEKNVIRRFTVVVDPRAAGKKSSIFLDIEVEPSHLVTVARQLSENENMASVYQMTGPSLLHCHALLNENEELDRFLQEVIYRLPGVIRVNSKIILSRFKERDGLLI